MDFEIEETNLYIIKHKKSSSEAQIKCGFDKDNKPKLLSVEMISGKVISLNGVRQLLKMLQLKHTRPNDPDQLA